MSDDRTRPLEPPPDGLSHGADGDDDRDRQTWVIAAVVAGALALLVPIVLLTDRGGDPTITGSPTPAQSTEATEQTTDSASPTPAETESPTEDGEPREATDADAAEFSESYRPAGAQAVQSATADVDGDGTKEVVFASLHDDASRIDVARWDGRAYRVVYTGQGGGAERIDDFKVADHNGDGTREIVTTQSVGAQGQSLSIWGWNGQAFAPQRASGGCWNGSHTYGVTGASIERGRIRATCDGSPLPTAAWPSDVYVWDADRGGWVYDHTEE